MKFIPNKTDFELSPYTGLTREDWIDAAKYILEGVFTNIKDNETPIVLPRKETEITYPHKGSAPEWRAAEERAEMFEGLTRTFFMPKACRGATGDSHWTLSGKRTPYMKDKSCDTRYFVLMLFAIAKELERRDASSPTEKIQVATGLPPGHYGALRKKFAGYFTGKGLIEFSYKGIQRRIIIQQAMVYPQAYAVAAVGGYLAHHPELDGDGQMLDNLGMFGQA